jgi:hypothetical protein
VPQAAVVVPIAQVPVVAVVEQHPPLHGCAPEQLVPHVCVPVAQACCSAQSVATLQPHAPATHAPPAGLPTQLVAAPQTPSVQVSTPLPASAPSPHRVVPDTQGPASKLDDDADCELEDMDSEDPESTPPSGPASVTVVVDEVDRELDVVLELELVVAPLVLAEWPGNEHTPSTQAVSSAQVDPMQQGSPRAPQLTVESG